MNVVLADLCQDHIDEALAAFLKRRQSKQVHAIRLDVTDRAAMATPSEAAERVFGKLHVLENNAGVGIQGPFSGITYADWDFGLAVNLGGVINGLQTFLPRIRAHGEGGHIMRWGETHLSVIPTTISRGLRYIYPSPATDAVKKH
jgi:NAD(P)-dependent dehydrogenase (short-subunit alcohol dehydrogenase family)